VTRLLHGRPLAERIGAESHRRAELLRERGIQPKLAAISVAADPAAATYLHRLSRSGAAHGIAVVEVALGRDATEPDLVKRLEELGRDPMVHGVLLLTPLPGALDEAHIVDHIPVEKDVEGMHPFNMGFLADGRPRFVPSTADAAIELLRFYEIPMRGARALIIGRSTVVGRPAALLLLREDATVTIAHTRTIDIERYTREAEIIIVGVGREGFLRGNMIARGATVIDAGINVTPNGITGAVDMESVSAVAGAVSPVPGGLGTVTTALLLRNVLTATERQLGSG